MRFVSPATKRIDLKDTVVEQADGTRVVTKNWIEVKKQLGKGEEAEFRAAGLGSVSQSPDSDKREIGMDYVKLAFARVMAYLVEWSAQNEKGKPVDISTELAKKHALRELETEDFDEIDDAIQKHIEEQAAEKKARSGSTTLTLASA
jgi:hypothetical protein